MAKRLNCKKGGLSISGGVVDITAARYVKFANPAHEIPADLPDRANVIVLPAVVERWIVDWVLFQSEEDLKKPFLSGSVIERGTIEIEYVPGVDPIQEAHAVLLTKLAETWEVTGQPVEIKHSAVK